jgi:hypothetical protein
MKGKTQKNKTYHIGFSQPLDLKPQPEELGFSEEELDECVKYILELENKYIFEQIIKEAGKEENKDTLK